MSRGRVCKTTRVTSGPCRISMNARAQLLTYLTVSTVLTLTHGRFLRTPQGKAEEQSPTDPEVNSLLRACYTGNLTMVSEIVVQRGVDTEVHDEGGWTPLNLASLAGHLSVVQFLVGVGANLESRDHSGQTPLGSAAINGHLEIVQYLLSLSPPANVDVRDDQGARPMHYAAQYGFALICNTLLHAGAEINSVTHVNGWTPLHAACAAGRVDTVKLLMDWHARTDLLDHDGMRPREVIGTTRTLSRRTIMILHCLLDPTVDHYELCKSSSVFEDFSPQTEDSEVSGETG